MRPKDKRVRAKYVRQISEHCISLLSQAQKAQFADGIDDLCRENAELMGGCTLTFMYEGEWYCAKGWNPVDDSNTILHSGLVDKMKGLLGIQNFDEYRELQTINNFIKNVFVFARHVDDIPKLIPGRLHHIIPGIEASLYNIDGPKSDKQIEAFLTKNQAGLSAFNRMFLLNLLMA